MHDCIFCDCACYCHGDIDDIFIPDGVENCIGCNSCHEEGRELGDEYDGDYDDEGEDFPEVKCKQCGCTDNNACSHPEHGNCWWVEPFLCSHCQMGLNSK